MRKTIPIIIVWLFALPLAGISVCFILSDAWAGGALQQTPGQFQIVSAGHTPISRDSIAPVVFGAWVLNTATGTVRFCMYDTGGVVDLKKAESIPPSMSCYPSVTPHAPDRQRK